MDSGTILLYLLIPLAYSTGGKKVTLSSLERCSEKNIGEMLLCDIYGDLHHFLFNMCPKNTFWTNQVNIVTDYSGYFICKECPLGTINEKPSHGDTVCAQDVSDLGKATLLTINIGEKCFPQYDLLRCDTDTGWKEFITCKRNQKWTGDVIVQNSNLVCVECPPNSFTPYDYHYNKTCIREEKNNKGIDTTNSFSTIRTNFINCLAYMISIFLIKKSMFC